MCSTSRLWFLNDERFGQQWLLDMTYNFLIKVLFALVSFLTKCVMSVSKTLMEVQTLIVFKLLKYLFKDTQNQSQLEIESMLVH